MRILTKIRPFSTVFLLMLGTVILCSVHVTAAWAIESSPSITSIPSETILKRAVQASSLIFQAPKSSTPPILNPLQEFVSVNPLNRTIDRTGCNAHSTAVPATPEINCALGDQSSSKLVVLVGDSNALMWTAALDTFGFANQIKVIYLTHPGCSPWSRPWVPQKAIVAAGIAESECTAWRKAAITKIIALRPNLIIPVGIDLSAPYTAPSGALEKSLAELINSIGSARTAFMEPPPKFSLINGPTGCVSIRPTSLNLCELQRSSIAQNPVSVAITKAALKVKIPIIRTADLFCGTQYCPIFVTVNSTTMLVYADGYHITKRYSQLLGKSLKIVSLIK